MSYEYNPQRLYSTLTAQFVYAKPHCLSRLLYMHNCLFTFMLTKLYCFYIAYILCFWLSFKKPFLYLVLLGFLCTANKESHSRGKLVSFLCIRQTLWHLNLLSIVKMALKTVKKLRPIHYSLTFNKQI